MSLEYNNVSLSSRYNEPKRKESTPKIRTNFNETVASIFQEEGLREELVYFSRASSMNMSFSIMTFFYQYEI